MVFQDVAITLPDSFTEKFKKFLTAWCSIRNTAYAANFHL